LTSGNQRRVGGELGGHDASLLGQLTSQRRAMFRRIEHCPDWLQPIKAQRLRDMEERSCPGFVSQFQQIQ